MKFNNIEGRATSGLILTFVFTLLFTFVSDSCRKENFEPPQDPFEDERLDANHAVILFGEGANVIRVSTNYENIDTTENGNLRIRGTLFSVHPNYGPIKITQGDFLLLKGSFDENSVVKTGYGELPVSPGRYTFRNKSGVDVSFQGFSGFSELNMPKLGILQNFSIATSLLYGVKIGYVLGSELDGWPVAANKYYFYMTTVNLVDASAADGKVNFSLGTTACALQKMALDVTDPYIYARVDVDKLAGGMAVLKEAGLGVSVQGNIPFRVPDDLKFSNVKDFDGQLILEAKIDVKDIFAQLPVPFLLDGQLVFAFDKRQPNAGAEFLDAKDVPFMMGGSGALSVDATGGYVPGLSLEIQLSDAAFSTFYKDGSSWEASFAGLVEIPPVQPGELIAQIVGGGEEYLKYLSFTSMTNRMWGTFGSDPSHWEYGWSVATQLRFFGMEISGNKTLIEFNPQHFYFSTEVSLALFADAGINGEIKSNGDMRLEGWSQAYFSDSFGPLSLTVDFDANIVLWIEAPHFGFELHGNFYGRACCEIPPWGGPLSYDACVSINVGFDAIVNTHGEFVVKARIGIDGFGFNITMNFSKKKELQHMEYEEIPIDEVPVDQQYYSEVYLKSHPELAK